jgi:type I restriction enzyme S subunit
LMEFLDNLKTMQIKDIISENVHRWASPSYDKNGEIPVIKTWHLKNWYIEISKEEFVNTDFYNKNTRSQVRFWDILIASTWKWSLWKIDIVENDEIDLICDSHVSIIRVNEKLYNSLFLTYFLRSILGIFQVERDYTWATNQIELYASEIENFQIPDISLLEQQKIVDEIKLELDKQELIKKDIEKERIKIDVLIEDSIKNR